MNGRHPRFDDWKQRARPSYMRQPLHTGAVSFVHVVPQLLRSCENLARAVHTTVDVQSGSKCTRLFGLGN